MTAPRRSRLQLMIDRLQTQRACLDHAAAMIAGRRGCAIPGCVVEVGLGKGRTYDHLRALFSDRRIYVFDLSAHAPPQATPPPEDLILGDFRDTLAAADVPPAALVHADVGSDDRGADAALAAEIAPRLAAMLGPGGWLLSDREMPAPGPPAPGLRALALPARDWPYFGYQRID